MTATARWYFNFWIWSVHVSTWIEVDTMVLRILDHSKMTSPPAYCSSAYRHSEYANQYCASVVAGVDIFGVAVIASATLKGRKMKKSEGYSRVWSWVMAVSLSVIASACGGGGQDPILGAGDVVLAVRPMVISVAPLPGATVVPLNTRLITATFSKAMEGASLGTDSFTLTCPSLAAVTGRAVTYFEPDKTATLALPVGTILPADAVCTATVGALVRDTTGVALGQDFVWQFTTGAALDTTAPTVVTPSIALNSARTFGTFGGSAGMTNMGTLTQINGDIGTTATSTSTITGFHDTAGDVYTETSSNIGAVNGKIYSCTNSVTGPTSNGTNPAACAAATQARQDAQAAYLALAAIPAGANPGANLAGLTLLPGTYTAPAGSFMVEGGNLTLDAQGNANAVWVFQMATTLTVGGPGAAFPESISLAGGAQAKNVYWQVGSFATINAAGGGTMVGTIISQTGASLSTEGNVSVVTLQGRVLSLGASVTLVNTVINVPQ